MNPLEKKPLRLGIAGIHIESSTFSPCFSTRENFHATRGGEMLERYPFLAKKEFDSITPVPLAHFRALPGGRIRSECYHAMKSEILDRLEMAGQIDAFYFDIHGAMAVDGLLDAEADLLGAIRQRIGPDMPVTCSQDLHGNLSDTLMAELDFITTYRTAPHVDWMETRERAVRLLLDWWRHPQAIYQARVAIPVLVSGEMSSTETDPGMRLYAPLAAESSQAGVWDASLWVGYAWADQARAMASAVAVGTDAQAVKATAEAIAQRYWDARRAFHFIAPAGPAGWCLEQALQLGDRAMFLSDAGDNPTAGAAGDVPATLQSLLDCPAFAAGGSATAIYASMPDAEAVALCAAADIGAQVTLCVGGKLDPIHGQPLTLTGVVQGLFTGDSVAGRQAVVRCGGVDVILTEKRKPFHKRADFLALGLDPLEHTVTVVKIGYLEPELKAMARHHWLVLSPGAVPPLLTSIDYRHLKRPMFPLDEDFEWSPVARVFEPSRTLGKR